MENVTEAVDIVLTPVCEPLDEIASERLRNSIRKSLRQGRRVHIIDLRKLRALDSPTLAAMIRLLRAVREGGGFMLLLVDQPHILRILSITGLDRVFPVYQHERDAFAALGTKRVIPA